MDEIEARVQKILDDINRTCCAKGSPLETLFYKVVLGGNVSHVRNVLWQLESDNKDLLKWLLKRPRQNGKRTNLFSKLLGIVLCVALWGFFSPFFYILHALTTNIVHSRRRKFSEHLELPLAFAALSYNPGMINIFLDYGVDPEQADNHGNNVFHYLAEASASKPKTALTAFRTICVTYRKGKLKELCMEQRNHLGLNAVEHCIRFGSLELFEALIAAEGMLKTTTFRAYEPLSGISSYYGNLAETGAFSEICTYDVTAYEEGDWMGKQSLLIHLLSCRDLLSETEKQVKGMQRMSVLSTWIGMKIGLMRPFIVLLHIGSFFLTAVLLFSMAVSEGEHKMLPLASDYLKTIDTFIIEAYEQYMTANDIDDVADVNYEEACPGNYSRLATKLGLDKCSYQAVEKISTSCGIDPTTAFSYIQWNSELMTESLAFTNYVLLPTLRVVMLLGVAYLSIDALMRLSAIMRAFLARGIGFSNGMVFLHMFPLPGSYLAKILNTLMCYFLVVYYVTGIQLNGIKETGDYLLFVQTEDLLSVTMVMIVILRILAHIHTLRLLPGIGYFVVTTFAMGATLLRFVIIYGTVLFAFAFLFHLFMRSPQCSLYRRWQFEDVYLSCFEAFKLMLGQGDFYYDKNASVRLAYVVYIVICVFLLLNFIIGIMGTIATQVMSEPWRQALWTNETLNEVLSTEALLLLVMAPVSCVLHPLLLRLVGYGVSRASVAHRDTADKCRVCSGCCGRQVVIKCFHKAEETDDGLAV